MKLSQSVRYAILALCQLDEPPARPVSCRQLAKLGTMPERFLLQVLRQLVTHEVLSSTRGVEGGYQLARPSTDISLLDIIQATEGPVKVEENGTLDALTSSSRTLLEATLEKMIDAQKASLGSLTLKQLRPAKQ